MQLSESWTAPASALKLIGPTALAMRMAQPVLRAMLGVNMSVLVPLRRRVGRLATLSEGYVGLERGFSGMLVTWSMKDGTIRSVGLMREMLYIQCLK